MEATNYEEFFPNCNVDCVEDEKHWHQLRGKGIGGSDAGIVMNVNNYKTPYELWYWNLIKTKTPPPFLENRNKELKEVS